MGPVTVLVVDVVPVTTGLFVVAGCTTVRVLLANVVVVEADEVVDVEVDEAVVTVKVEGTAGSRAKATRADSALAPFALLAPPALMELLVESTSPDPISW